VGVYPGMGAAKRAKTFPGAKCLQNRHGQIPSRFEPLSKDIAATCCQHAVSIETAAAN
jgi:hypothetical protein